MEGTTNSVQMLHFWSFLKVIILLANCAGKRALSQFPPTPLSGGSWPGERYWRQWRGFFFAKRKSTGPEVGLGGVYDSRETPFLLLPCAGDAQNTVFSLWIALEVGGGR